MRFEHCAINVPDPASMAHWYVEHLRMTIVRAIDGPPHTHFLADATGRTVVEIYNNPKDAVPVYAGQHPLRFHLAFAVDDPELLKSALIAAGASFFEEARPDPGSLLIMLRDPWGIPLQLCRRSDPMP
jgi:catechol 2,3-dioxygenase-like lactoylglutathione lyase family enzyme